MKRPQKINAYIYKLLIEKEMNNFSVIEARNVALALDGDGNESDELRKIIYRQIRYFERKGWLYGEGKGRSRKYFKTDSFHSHCFESKKKSLKMVEVKTSTSKHSDLVGDYSELMIEQKRLKDELDVTLGEIEKYRVLKDQYPEQTMLLDNLQASANEKAVFFMGNINAITKVLNSL